MGVVAPKLKPGQVAANPDDPGHPFGVAATLPAVLETAAALIPADAVSVWLLDMARGQWHVEAARGLSDDYVHQILPSGGDDLGTEPICAPDVDRHPLLQGRAELYRREQIRSLMAMPLCIRGERRGTLVFYFREPHKFTDAERARASALANLASSALASAELYDQQAQAKQELERRELEARTLLNSLPDYIARFDRELRYLYKSEHPELAAPMPAAQYIGKTFRDFEFPSQAIELWEKTLRSVFETAQPRTVEYSLPAPQGAVRHYVGVVTPEIARDGRVESVMTITRDVTDQRNAAEKLRRSEAQLRLIIDSMPGLVAYVDRQQVFRRVNRTFERWFNGPIQSFIGKTILEVLGEHNYSHLREHIERALQGETVQYEATNVYRDATRRVLINYVPDIDESGTVCGFVALVMDVTERHSAEEALRKTEKLAAAGRLAASIAHEINNPLESITNLLFLLQRETALTEAGRTYLAMAEDELARVSHIATQTLRFHRQSTRPTMVRVEDIVDAVEGLYQRRMASSGVRLEKRYGSTEKINVLDGELRQLLANLIGNALDATPPGGKIIVRTRAAVRGGIRGVRIAIADTGHGIPPELIKRMFEPFVTTKGTTGTGLGLWVSREIVEKHQGYMRVRSCDSGPKMGTVFSVFIGEMGESG